MVCEAGRLADVNGTDNANLREESAAQFAKYSFQGSKNAAVRRNDDTESIRGRSEIYEVGAWADIEKDNGSQLLDPIDEESELLANPLKKSFTKKEFKKEIKVHFEKIDEQATFVVPH